MDAQAGQDEPLVLKLYNPYPYQTLFNIVVHWGSLPDGTKLYLALGQTAGDSLASLSKKDLERLGSRPGGREIRELFEVPLEEQIQLNLDRVYSLFPDANRRTTLPDMLIAPERPAVVAMRLVLPKKLDGAPPQFDMVQMAGQRVLGGCTFVVRRQ
ncbi:MAG: hypothetical protein HYV04_06220 [Deltaproteobacteria bacterium]|nr:hypothetical protein [Deltaproteobacteria bacterium]